MDELGIGIRASVHLEREYFPLPHDDEDQDAEDDTKVIGVLDRYLVFDRLNGSFRIHINEMRERETDDTHHNWICSIGEDSIAWSSCDRETKLHAFEKLPALLDEIVSKAESLAEKAEQTTVKVKEMVGEGLGAAGGVGALRGSRAVARAADTAKKPSRRPR